MSEVATDADLAHAAALAGFPMMGPARLRALLDAWPPCEAWSRVRAGAATLHEGVRATFRNKVELAQARAAWRDASCRADPLGTWPAYAASAVQVGLLGTAEYPAELAGDHEAPAVVFFRGDPAVVDGPRVGIVGTRRCTHAGREVARELGRDLAAAGVRVVSGLAAGIDGAAHAGALAAGAAPPIGIVGSGLDVVYPARHGDLWRAVGEAGLLLSEAPLGARPEPWRFPCRNRIIAALSDVVVVVESHSRGGSRYTVDEAMARGRTVMAVPGSVRTSAAAFTNDLLAECCPPARDATDVLVALGLATAGGARAPRETRSRPAPDDVEVLDHIGADPTDFERLAALTGLTPARLSVALARLEVDGWVIADGGRWLRV